MKPRIMVPFDFSETADAALAWAADLRATTGGPPLEIVHAVDARTLGTPEMPVCPVLPDENETARLEQMMRDAAARYQTGANVHVVVQSSEIPRIVTDAARELCADLIAMGTHGLTGVRRLLLGSVAEHVVRHAPCPVVTVRSGPKPVG
ncbi:MAG TPA: universal stress protein [Polyangia bacterium]|jgi:nucleotide-binding universal stress UspA family protein|nr:universal stress protein [Polyangia bacterium]